MLNERYDVLDPYETTAKLTLDLLGTSKGRELCD